LKASFEFSQLQDAPSNGALFDEMKAKYLVLAKDVGIQTGLDHIPELPLDWFGPSKPSL
jgi:hypothetical protein